MSCRIVADSSANIYDVPGVDFRSVPLAVMFDGRMYPDQPGTDVEAMTLDLQEWNGVSSTSCPNIYDWLQAYEGADEIIVFTISGALSGSNSSAVAAADQYRDAHPEAQVFVMDTLTTGPEMELLIEHAAARIAEGVPFDLLCEDVRAYKLRTHILFSLASLKNLANNGRVNAAVAKIADMLDIRVVGTGDENGSIKLISKYRGEKKAFKALLSEMVARGFTGGRVRIAHCLNANAASKLEQGIKANFADCDVSVRPCGALCSYYADKGGLIIGFEGGVCA
jgi:DegV family protein with EDD domain